VVFFGWKCPVKRKAEQDMVRYERNKTSRKRRLEYLMEEAMNLSMKWKYHQYPQ